MLTYAVSTYIIAAILFTYAKKWNRYGIAFFTLSPIVLPIAVGWGIVTVV
jgi:hypothetical protein